MKIFFALSLALVMAGPVRWIIKAQPHFNAQTLQTSDAWRSVRTNNLVVFGNADAESLR
jgi:hypothetical protein